jgi:sulfite reductase beta subunit-like hemoprotein
MRPTKELLRQGIEWHRQNIAKFQAGELSTDEFRKKRLAYGVYYQLDHTSHMQRIKIPAGLLNADQLEVLAEQCDKYGRGVGHVTTRQNIQFHWVPIEETPEMFEALDSVGITTRGACFDSVRTITACPHSGLSKAETFDVIPYARALTNHFLFNDYSLSLPRKFKIAFSDCKEDGAYAMIHDIGYYAKVRGGNGKGTKGFSVYCGGGLGGQPHEAVCVSEFVPVEDLLVFSEAIVRLFHRDGNRKDRRKARSKFLVKSLGVEEYKKRLYELYPQIEAQSGEELRADLQYYLKSFHAPSPLPLDAKEEPQIANDSEYLHWRRTNVEPQRQEGYAMVTVKLIRGDFTSNDIRELAQLARRFTNGAIRITQEQNFLLPFVRGQDLYDLYKTLKQLKLAEADARHITDVLSCPGGDYCSLAVTRSMKMAAKLREHLLAWNQSAEEIGPFHVKISGCPNSCAQHQIADVGLTGLMAKDGKGIEKEHYSIMLGGGSVEGKLTLGTRLKGKFPEEETPKVLAALAVYYNQGRTLGESFHDFVQRVGMKPLNEIAQKAVEVSPD